MTIHRTTVICLISLLTFPTGAFADTFVTVDTTQNGGVFNNNAPTLVISHLTNVPLFTLTNGATTTNVEALIVGNLNGESGQLLIEDGSSLNNDGMGVIGTYGTESVLGGYAYLGLNAGSSGSATITGPGSTWTNSGILNVGHSGNGTLNINNGGVVTNGLTYVGSNAGGVGNVTVTGTASELISASANIVGIYGQGTLGVLDGARVYTPTGYIGLEAGSMGTVTVSGSGSTWENAADLNIGLAGTGELNINNGGYVTSQNSDIGLSPEGTGIVNLAGTNSRWDNANNMTVGNEGQGTLNITNGAFVSSKVLDTALQTSGSGTINVTGLGSTLQVNELLSVGYFGQGTLNADDRAQIETAYTNIGEIAGATGIVNISGENTHWQNSTDIVVGFRGVGTLDVTEQASTFTPGMTVGAIEGSLGKVTIDGPATSIENSILTNVGFSGSGTIDIKNGGTLRSKDAKLSINSSGNGTVNVFDSGSAWIVENELLIGRASEAVLNITEGGFVSANSINLVGLDSTVNISGLGSVLDTEEITVGNFGFGFIEVSDKAQLNSNSAIIGAESGYRTFQSEVTVDGAGSEWNVNQLVVGENGGGLVRVVNNGQVNAVNGFLGTGDGLGEIEVEGAGSVLNVNEDLIVGDIGRGETRLRNGKIVNRNTYVGFEDDSYGVVYSYFDSNWDMSGDLIVGNKGFGHFSAGELGGNQSFSSINNSNAFVGNMEGGQGTVSISRSSEWINSGDLYIGNHGEGNLSISRGGKVSNDTAIVGHHETGVGSVIVGFGQWDNSEDLFVGFDGIGTVRGLQSANITTGRDLFVGYNGKGTVEIVGEASFVGGRDVALGYNAGSEGIMIINGVGARQGNEARLIVGDFFDVGQYGTGTLKIEDGGLVVSPGGGINGHYESFIGHFAGSTGVATVTGDGSRWEMSRSLTIGSEGNGTLNIVDGGYVTNHFSFIGASDGSVGSVTVDGEGSLWDSRNYIRMDETSSLTISNQGHVTTPWAADIAYDADSVATVLVTGENSKLTVGGFVVGRFGHGTMNIENGGYASAVTGTLVGFAGTGITRVTGAGSHLDINDLTVGAESGGNGTLEVLNGGLVTTNSSTSIAHRAGSIGRIDVDGVGSTLQVGYDLYIGTDGAAQFNITDGGHVIVENNAWLGANQVDPIASVSGTGSKWSINNGLFIGANTNTSSTVDIFNGGFVSVDGLTRVYNNDVLNIVGGTLRTGSLDVETGGTFNLDGGTLILDGGLAEGLMYTAINGSRIGGTGMINELMIGADGVLMPGESPGLLHVNVAELLGDGIYEWEINSVAGQAGESIGWDLVTFETLQLSASDNDEFVIEINSLTEMNNNGRLADFDPFSSYTWLIAASNDVDPFDVDSFALDLAEFDNLFFDGNFSLSTGAANYGGFAHGLFLNYTAATVPEPNGLAILLVALALANQRRRRVKTASQKLN